MPHSVVQRIRSEVRRGLRHHERIVLAVSGGVDSMVLLDAAAAVAPERIVVATFDHRTGAEATRAATLVSTRCETLVIKSEHGVSFAMLETEAGLRAARWRFLNDVASKLGGVVATAHTADDQIETVLMRTLRGAGARGLAGLAADSRVSRPLLGVRKTDVLAYAHTRGVEWVEDPSNASVRFFRNRIRHELLPALRSVAPRIDEYLLDIGSRAAQWRREVECFIDDTLGVRVLQSRPGLDVDAEGLRDYSVFELRELLPAVLARAGVVLDRRGIVRLAEFARRTRVGARVQLSGAWEVTRSRESLQVRAARDAERTPRALALSEPTNWYGWSFSPTGLPCVDTSWSARLPADLPLTVRAWRAGDAMIVGARARRRKVKDLLSRAGITGNDRVRWPVVVAGDDIVWIPGVRRSEAAADSAGQPGLSFVCEPDNR